MSTLKDTITKWDYFVNWRKIFENLKEVEIDLNIMNYLIGKNEIENEFYALIKKHPSVIRIIPILLACRQKYFKILTNYSYEEFEYKCYSFTPKDKLTDTEIAETVEFVKSTGFLTFLEKQKIKNLVDYVIGVEVGLNSNGRKNRGGNEMENIVQYFIKELSLRNGFEYINQATADKIKQKWGLKLTVDKSYRVIDFAVFNSKRLYLIETNFYSGGGSKLKSTAGEYKTMYDFWKKDGHCFIWITDGLGWQTAKLPLQETFIYIDYVLNLDMVANRLLEDIVVGSL
ncbi:MAG: type II restriction endonuclease [Candidatus Magnetoovum sp. WYHC-5]|nr:type II restriction endonuclease [Candidatus Magnetoovum sp. WYHC-5]